MSIATFPLVGTRDQNGVVSFDLRVRTPQEIIDTLSVASLIRGLVRTDVA